MTARELDTSCPPGLCQWPIGDPADPDFRYCRAPVARPGEPYCAEHRARAWATAEQRAQALREWRAERRRRTEGEAA